ncbi:MAG: DUF1573 domain-containing protein [Cytophagales bacterium]|nr:DUF1573 domain-containing protein [Cytophagales bacterium]
MQLHYPDEMKYIFLLSLITMLQLVSCSQKDEIKDTSPLQASDSVAVVKTESTTTMSFEAYTYDFGKVKQGEIVKKTFIFKNTGSNPLVISNASASCGCTVPNWPKQPIAPGANGNIDVQFNSTGKSGAQNKTVIITANTVPNTTTLILKGVVESPVGGKI